ALGMVVEELGRRCLLGGVGWGVGCERRVGRGGDGVGVGARACPRGGRGRGWRGVRGPGAAAAPGRRGRAAGAGRGRGDVGAAVREAGQRLLPLVRGEKVQVRDYACAGVGSAEALEWALRTPEWGFVLPERAPPGDAPRGPQLYVKPDDRWEVNNVLQHHL